MENNQQGMKLLEGAESFRNLVLSGDKIHVLVEDPVKGEKGIREIIEAEGLKILDLMIVKPSLEDAFISIVRSKSSPSSFAKRG